MIETTEIKPEFKPELKIEYLPKGLWRLWVNGNPSPITNYEHTIVFLGYLAMTSYWRDEGVYELSKKVKHYNLDNSYIRKSIMV